MRHMVEYELLLKGVHWRGTALGYMGLILNFVWDWIGAPGSLGGELCRALPGPGRRSQTYRVSVCLLYYRLWRD